MTSATIIIPCYNEARRLSLDKYREFLSQCPGIRLFFVNDGSSDTTGTLLDHLAANHKETVTVLHLKQNAGKAEAIRQGFLHAFKDNPDHIGYWDADLSTPLAMIPRFSELLNNRPILMIMGSRVRLLGRTIERSFWRHYLGRIFATHTSLMLRLPVYDTQCGAKLFKNEPFLQRIFAAPFATRWIFDVEILARMLLLRKWSPSLSYNLRTQCLEYPLEEWISRPGSKVRWSDLFRCVSDVILLTWLLHFSSKQSSYTTRLLASDHTEKGTEDPSSPSLRVRD